MLVVPGLCRNGLDLGKHVGGELRQVVAPVSGRVSPLVLHVFAAAGRKKRGTTSFVVRGLEGRAGME